MLKRRRATLLHNKCLKRMQKELFNLHLTIKSHVKAITIISLLICFVFLFILYIKEPSIHATPNLHNDIDKMDAQINDAIKTNTFTPSSTNTKNNVSLQLNQEKMNTSTSKHKMDGIDDDNVLIEFSTNWQKICDSIRNINISIHTDRKESNKYRIISSERAKQIKTSFKFAWDSYAQYALGHDGISPVNGVPSDVWGGLAATLVDALDTMILMGFHKEYAVALSVLQNVDFNIDLKASFFETTIRHLGGLIGAYNMNSFISNTIANTSEIKKYEEILLSKATGLANNLLKAFSTDSGIPKSMVNLQSGEIENYGWTSGKSVLAEIGSNQLEMYAMSKYTNDTKYYTKSKKVYKLLNVAGAHGLFPRLVDPQSVTFSGTKTLGGMSDSAYEYFLKLWVLTKYENKIAIKLFVEAISAANEELLRIVHDTKRREKAYYFYGEKTGVQFQGTMEELVCFMPGVLALSSYHAMLRKQESEQYTNVPLTEYEERLFEDREKYLQLAHVLVETCYSLFKEMETGLAPESIVFSDDSWSVSKRKYQLRPETVESLFILYSLTRTEQYREWAWNIFRSIETHCKTKYAFSGIQDVTRIGAKKDNQMQSFFMAETLKYLYLMFDSNTAAMIPLHQYVFNTEAHLIRI